MGLFDFDKPKETKITVEVFKGMLEKDSVSDSTKKEFAELKDIKEATFITKGAPEKVLTLAKEKLKFDLNASEDFQVSYLVYISKETRIVKIQVVISEGIDEEFSNLLEKNNFVLRIINQ